MYDVTYITGKNMRNILVLAISALVLMSCAEARYSGSRISDTVQREIQLSKDKIGYILDPDRRIIDSPPQPFPSRYCYKNFGDVVCYKDPIPNAETRLVGYQEPGNRTDWNDKVGTAPVDERYQSKMRSTYNPWKDEYGKSDYYVARSESAPSIKTGGTSAKTKTYIDSQSMSGSVETVPPLMEVKGVDVPRAKTGGAAYKKPASAAKKSAHKGKKKSAAKKQPARKKTKTATAKKATAVTPSDKATAVPVAPAAAIVPLAPAAPAAADAKVEAPKAEPVKSEAPKSDTPKAAAPAEAQEPKPVQPKTIRDLKEIKYDPKDADPKDLLKSRQ